MSSLLNIAAGNPAAGDFYDYQIENSLRFDRASNADLTRTPSSDGDRQRFTVSVWAKPSSLATTASDSISFFGVNDGSSANRASFYIGLENLVAYVRVSNTFYFLTTSIKFRDVSAWYNFVWAVDTTQATASNRAKLYVNGEQITQFTTENYPPLNATTSVNGQFAHNVGSNDEGNDHMDGYLADFNFIDGQQLDPTSFGETKSGVWIPKDTSALTFGTNGFRLKFEADQLGTDYSGTLDPFGDSSCVALYQFEDNTNDTSGNFNGTNTGVTFTETSPFGFGKAGVFDSNDYVTTSTSNYGVFNTTSYSLSLWVKWSTSTYNDRIIFSNDSSNTNFQHLAWQINAGGISFRDRAAGMGGSDLAFAITPVEGVWYHIGVTRSGSNFVLYLDGAQVATDTGNTNTNDDGNFLIGTSPRTLTNTAYRWLGEIDQLRVFNRTLTAAEMAELGSVIGVDSSSGGNNFAVRNLRSYDVVPDSPTNNFATIDRLGSVAGVFSEGNLKYVSTGDTGNSNLGVTSGKFYIEVNVLADSNSYIGICDLSKGLNPNRGGAFTANGAIVYKSNGDQYSLPAGGSSATASYGSSYTTGDIIGISFDVDADTVTFYKNNVSQGTTTNGLSFISSDGIYGLLLYGTNSTFVINFGQDSTFAGNETAGGNADENGIGDFYYTPQGLALCTANLPEPTISPLEDEVSEDYFNTVLYSGNSSTQSVTGVGFQPDWLWLKSRTTSNSHILADSVRGSGSNGLFILITNSTGAELDEANIASLDSDGFTLGSNAGSNGSGRNFVAWNWKAGGTAVSNTDGSITSSVSANTEAGFSIVTYTGNSSSTATVGHGLGVAPKMVVIKRRNTTDNWQVSISNITGTTGQRLYLNLTQGISTDTTREPTKPSSSVITIGGNDNTNGGTHVAYCFAEIEGYSKFGSYTGNGSANGTFVSTGFRPAWIMTKRNGTSNWTLFDNKRLGYNVDNNRLYPNDSSADNTVDIIDILSNGFKIRSTVTDNNASGSTYIYMAFAEMPFKYANAR